jgi:hypothetical protein
LVGGARGLWECNVFLQSFQKENISQCFEKLVGLFGTEARSLETLQPLEKCSESKTACSEMNEKQQLQLCSCFERRTTSSCKCVAKLLRSE